nr:hypothetical protein CFP56_54382 [Quercus suber]
MFEMQLVGQDESLRGAQSVACGLERPRSEGLKTVAVGTIPDDLRGLLFDAGERLSATQPTLPHSLLTVVLGVILDIRPHDSRSHNATISTTHGRARHTYSEFRMAPGAMYRVRTVITGGERDGQIRREAVRSSLYIDVMTHMAIPLPEQMRSMPRYGRPWNHPCLCFAGQHKSTWADLRSPSAAQYQGAPKMVQRHTVYSTAVRWYIWSVCFVCDELALQPPWTPGHKLSSSLWLLLKRPEHSMRLHHDCSCLPDPSRATVIRKSRDPRLPHPGDYTLPRMITRPTGHSPGSC